MWLLILGLVLFLGTHTFVSLRGQREQAIAKLGAGPYRGVYTVVAVVGIILIAWGFARYRSEGLIPVWAPPYWTHYVAIVLMWFAWVSLLLANKAPSRIRGWIKHPMLLSVKIWALAHLLANGDAGGLLLFGLFLAWAVYDRIAVKRRGDLGAARISAFTRADGVNLVVGTVAYVAMIFLHPYLIGVSVV
jgi:uncharacterized membrane protein